MLNDICLSVAVHKALAENGQLPDLEDFKITNIMANDEMFRLFCESILACVVGKTWWSSKAGKKTVSEMATVSDEAFGLLLLENSYDMWKAMGEDPSYEVYRRKETTVDMSKRVMPVVGTEDSSNKETTGDKDEHEEDGANPAAGEQGSANMIEKGRQRQRRRRSRADGDSGNTCKYPETRWTRNGPDTKKYHGWQLEGMNRYSKLYEDVKKTRRRSKQRREREIAYMKVQNQLSAKKRKPKVSAPPELKRYEQPNGFEDMLEGLADQEMENELLGEGEFALSEDEEDGRAGGAGENREDEEGNSQEGRSQDDEEEDGNEEED